MIAVWLLFIFYIVIIIVRLIPKNEVKKVKWDEIVIKPQITDCIKDSDCISTSQICFLAKCREKLRGDDCNPKTGQWLLFKFGDKEFVKCVCKYPDIIGQNFDGSNCNVSVACRPHGRLIDIMNFSPNQRRNCICDPGYAEKFKYRCEKLTPYEDAKQICNSDEISRIEAHRMFHTEYINNLDRHIKCFKKPCSYNVFNGNPLKHTKYDQNVGCYCDPSHGNFGVRFQNGKMLNTEYGYDACANIFVNEPDFVINAKMYTYYYINGDTPIAFVSFSQLYVNEIIPELQPLVKKHSLQIAENDWSASFAQHVFRSLPYRVRTRKCFYLDSKLKIYIEICNEFKYLEYQMSKCEDITNKLESNVNIHINSYNLLYTFPVCYFTGNDVMYKDKFIVNPFHVTYEKSPLLTRSNGFVMAKYGGMWYVDLADSNYLKYGNTLKAPVLNDEKLRKFNMI